MTTEQINQTEIDGEIWKDIPGYKAQASSLGRIKSFYSDTVKGVIRKPQNGLRSKYHRIQFVNETTISVHRLVALAFHENPNHLPIVNHKDGNGLNNRPDNLEWCDQKHNVNHANNRTINKYHRFSSEEKQIIRDTYAAGFSKLSIGKYFGVTDTTIRRIVNV